MITPPFLEKSDKIAIVSTARKVSREELEFAVNLVKSWGLEALIGKTIGAEQDQFAGNDALRTEDFQQMLDHPEIKAIWCARGGYGTVRIIDNLDFTQFKKHPKWIIGYSDVTVLHSHLNILGFQTLHAPLAFDIAHQNLEVQQNLQDILFGKNTWYKIPSHIKNRPGTAEGELIGGNLSILYSLCGSASAVETKDKILFIEDLDEYLYHIDRMLQNLKRNGVFKHLAGMIVGGMTKMHDNTIPFGKTVIEIIEEVVAEYHFPVCYHFPAGHTPENNPLVFGKKIKLEVLEDYVQIIF